MSDQAVILIFSLDLMSHFFRSLRLAIVLKDQYKVYMNVSERYAEWQNIPGLNLFNCIEINADTALEKTGKFDFSWLNAADMEKVFLAQVKAIEAYSPALVMGDTSFTLKMAAEATGVSYVSTMNAYSTRFYGFTRRLSPKHRAASFVNIFPLGLLLPMTRLGEAWNFYLILKAFNRVRSKYQLKKTFHFLEEISGDVNLLCDLPEIFPQKKLPANYHFIGPLFYKQEISGSPVLGKLNPHKHTLLITMGSSDEWERVSFLNSEEYSRYNVIVVGERKGVLQAPFLIKASFVNFEEVLPKVDLMICHGGNGTLYNALVNHVAVLSYQSHLEQTWNVQRIEELGFGQSLEKVKPKNISLVIESWLEKRSCINWNLDFGAFNPNFQNNLLLQLVAGLQHNSLT